MRPTYMLNGGSNFDCGMCKDVPRLGKKALRASTTGLGEYGPSNACEHDLACPRAQDRSSYFLLGIHIS